MAARLTADPGRSGATSEWRNWQTRQPKELVFERTWGFKSPLRHHENPYLVGVFGASGAMPGRFLLATSRMVRQTSPNSDQGDREA